MLCDVTPRDEASARSAKRRYVAGLYPEMGLGCGTQTTVRCGCDGLEHGICATLIAPYDTSRSMQEPRQTVPGLEQLGDLSGCGYLIIGYMYL